MYCVLQLSASISWKVFRRDTGPKGKNNNALAYLEKVLNELMEKSCNIHDGRFRFFCLSCPVLYNILL